MQRPSSKKRNYRIVVKSANKTWSLFADSEKRAKKNAIRYMKKMLPDKVYLRNNPKFLEEFFANIYEDETLVREFSVDIDRKVIEKKIRRSKVI